MPRARRVLHGSDAFDADLPPDRRVAALAHEQYGVVACGQLIACGLERGAIALRVANGRLLRLHQGVYAVGHTRLTRHGRWLAAVLARGPGAALSHGGAAALWDLAPTRGGALEVSVPTVGGRSRPGLVIHRAPTLAAADVTRRDGVPVTTPARTLLDYARRAGP